MTIVLARNHMLPDNDFPEWISIVSKMALRLENANARFGSWRAQDNVESESHQKMIKKDGMY